MKEYTMFIKKYFILFIFFAIFGLNQFYGDTQSKIISIKINAGKNYTHNYGILKLIPQIAIWIEDINGNYIDTIYVTFRSAKSQWRGGNNIRRPEALPIWSYKKGIKYEDGLYMPTRNKPLNDSITGATPTSSFAKEWKIPTDLKQKIFILKIEVNNSFDYNNIYNKKLPKDSLYYNNVNGQPSLLYEGKIDLSKNNNEIKLNIIGHGDVMGNNGNINKDISFLTDSLNIIDSIYVYIK